MRHHQLLRKTNGRILIALALLISSVVVAGCSEPAKTPSTPASAPKAVQKQPIVSAPTPTTVSSAEENLAPVYSYNPAGRRDPFAPIIVKDDKKAKAGDRPPLERFNVNEFKLTGIIWGGFGYNAMMEGPDGKGYFVRVGTIIGPNRGVVKSISQHAVVIEEKYKTYTGETERKEIIVELRKKQEERP